MTITPKALALIALCILASCGPAEPPPHFATMPDTLRDTMEVAHDATPTGRPPRWYRVASDRAIGHRSFDLIGPFGRVYVTTIERTFVKETRR